MVDVEKLSVFYGLAPFAAAAEEVAQDNERRASPLPAVVVASDLLVANATTELHNNNFISWARYKGAGARRAEEENTLIVPLYEGGGGGAVAARIPVRDDLRLPRAYWEYLESAMRSVNTYMVGSSQLNYKHDVTLRQNALVALFNSITAHYLPPAIQQEVRVAEAVELARVDTVDITADFISVEESKRVATKVGDEVRSFTDFNIPVPQAPLYISMPPTQAMQAAQPQVNFDEAELEALLSGEVKESESKRSGAPPLPSSASIPSSSSSAPPLPGSTLPSTPAAPRERKTIPLEVVPETFTELERKVRRMERAWEPQAGDAKDEAERPDARSELQQLRKAVKARWKSRHKGERDQKNAEFFKARTMDRIVQGVGDIQVFMCGVPLTSEQERLKWAVPPLYTMPDIGKEGTDQVRLSSRAQLALVKMI